MLVVEPGLAILRTDGGLRGHGRWVARERPRTVRALHAVYCGGGHRGPRPRSSVPSPLLTASSARVGSSPSSSSASCRSCGSVLRLCARGAPMTRARRFLPAWRHTGPYAPDIRSAAATRSPAAGSAFPRAHRKRGMAHRAPGDGRRAAREISRHPLWGIRFTSDAPHGWDRAGNLHTCFARYWLTTRDGLCRWSVLGWPRRVSSRAPRE